MHNQHTEKRHSQEGRVFTNDSGDRGLILGGVIPKTQKMVLDDTLLNTQFYWVWWSRKSIDALPLYLSVVENEKGAFGSPLTFANFICIVV